MVVVKQGGTVPSISHSLTFRTRRDAPNIKVDGRYSGNVDV